MTDTPVTPTTPDAKELAQMLARTTDSTYDEWMWAVAAIVRNGYTIVPARSTPAEPHKHDWTASTQPGAVPGLPGSTCADPNCPARSTLAEALPPCPICGKGDLFIGTDGRPGCPHCEVAVTLPRSTPADALDVDTLLAAERVVQGWDDEISEGGMVPLIEDLRQALERRILARLSRNEEGETLSPGH